MTKENIFQTYVKEICSKCKNRNKNDCHLTRRQNNTIKCEDYEREDNIQVKKQPASWQRW